MKCGVTPENITELQGNEVFVFGSNLAGVHGAGAARRALLFGAKMGCGRGIQGRCYAIPTKDENIETLPLHKISEYVDSFYSLCYQPPIDMYFLVTKIGCGLAGYNPEDTAPLFGARFLELGNVSLPQEFIELLL